MRRFVATTLGALLILCTGCVDSYAGYRDIRATYPDAGIARISGLAWAVRLPTGEVLSVTVGPFGGLEEAETIIPQFTAEEVERLVRRHALAPLPPRGGSPAAVLEEGP